MPSPDVTAQRVQALYSQLAGWPGTVVAVTKTATLDDCRASYNAGITHFGENRVQLMQQKQQALTDLPLHWHMIGPLQRNKVSKVVGQVALIHSIDTLAIAEKIHEAASVNTPQPVLLQVNWLAEPQKHGFSPEILAQQWPALWRLPGLSIQGLMWVAPQGLDSDQLKAGFTGVAHFRDQLQQLTGHSLPQLSMGMSQDFDIAVGCGATIIRVGSRLFA